MDKSVVLVDTSLSLSAVPGSQSVYRSLSLSALPGSQSVYRHVFKTDLLLLCVLSGPGRPPDQTFTGVDTSSANDSETVDLELHCTHPVGDVEPSSWQH
ncbi:hypothetical protein ElyMa_006969800 [Elysia marginata]|uniref:Uncharacterized protein n=1 Tax=Elysia marginata TaxID=1093978 RepID=A0AAV4JN60_9GAST|nr:hypothetical protein ElyMa_006969800 [Elysia marginata]